MKSLSNINMAAVTRLTREGRLDEAMHLLRGGRLLDPGCAARPASTSMVGDEAPVIDMEPPSAANGGAWTAPSVPASTRQPSPSPSTRSATLDRLLKPRIRIGAVVERASAALPPGARFEERTHGSALAQLSYKLYVPGSHDGTPLGLLVMLHGCTQSPDDFARGTRMNTLAEEHGFVVAYPAQAQSANASRCWNWFSASHQHRDGGEPSLVAGITREVMRELAIDPRRVHVAGLSAGGAMASILGAAYPELYAAVGVHSGLAPHAAHDMPSAFAAMRRGAAHSAASGRNVPTIVFHGDADPTVSAINGDQVMEQARGTAQLYRRTEAGCSADGVAYTRSVESFADGRPCLEQWLLHGGGHAWSGGDPGGSFVAPHGPDASREMLRFFAETGAAPNA